MLERRQHQRRILSDRRWGGDRRRADRRKISVSLDDLSVVAPGGESPRRDRRVRERRSGLERRVLRGRILADRRRDGQEAPPETVKDADDPPAVRARLDDNPNRVRGVIEMPERHSRVSGRGSRLQLLWIAGLVVLAVLLLVVILAM